MLNIDALNQLKALKQEIQDSRVLANGVVKGTPNRFGFVTLDQDGRDVFLNPDEMLKVFPGDEIEVEIHQDEKGKEFAAVEKLLRSPLRNLVGRYVCKGNAHFVETDVPGLNRWIYLPPKLRKDAKEGDYIFCRIKQHPMKAGKPQAEVLKTLGTLETLGIERQYNILKFGLEDNWDTASLNQLKTLNESIIAEQTPLRRDLRDELFVTIDSPSTTDMDDALSIRSDDNGWILRVAIADPAAVIEPDSALEKTLYRRASSVYFPGEPLPMLPEAISSQLCSLVPGADRLALICELGISSEGALRGFELFEGVIHSKAKLSYGEVAAYLNEPAADHSLKSRNGLAEQLDMLWQAAQQLSLCRQTQALINDDKTEFRLRLNEKQKIESIDPLQYTPAHQIVEECMILANRSAADFLNQKSTEGLYITHRGVRNERRESVQSVINAQLPEEDAGAIDTLAGFANVMRYCQSHVMTTPLRTIITRQLDRSEFASQAAPHFGMGLERYTTFTSPLRKANDFYVHRLIKQILNGERCQHLNADTLGQLQEQNKNARNAVNETENWLKRQFLATLPKQSFTATVLRMNASGFTVRLNNNGIEGFVSTKDMPEKYSFNNDLFTLTGKSASYQLDQEVCVELANIDERRKQIVFKIAQSNEGNAEK